MGFLNTKYVAAKTPQVDDMKSWISSSYWSDVWGNKYYWDSNDGSGLLHVFPGNIDSHFRVVQWMWGDVQIKRIKVKTTPQRKEMDLLWNYVHCIDGFLNTNCMTVKTRQCKWMKGESWVSSSYCMKRLMSEWISLYHWNSNLGFGLLNVFLAPLGLRQPF